MIPALDPGDLNWDGAPASEYRGRVRDGDRGEVMGGYPLMSMVARDVRSGQALPLYTRLLSSQRRVIAARTTRYSTPCRRRSAICTLARCRSLIAAMTGGDCGPPSCRPGARC
ncbi:MAG TPA: hypothetical protein VFA48_00560 [Gammaproteobacteria bacterium]|nr:hypothetical protein [Gammaproteobacteria bacterium]